MVVIQIEIRENEYHLNIYIGIRVLYSYSIGPTNDVLRETPFFEINKYVKAYQ